MGRRAGIMRNTGEKRAGETADCPAVPAPFGSASTAVPLLVGAAAAEDHPATPAEELYLSSIEKGNEDKFGNEILELCWIGRNYKIYRSEKGIFVHFSDSIEEASQQRKKFTEISPELCELRYLTSQMHPPWNSRREIIFDYNICQAIMLTMEDKPKVGKDIARWALELAAARVSNDNTIRYLVAAFFTAAATLLILAWRLNGFAGIADATTRQNVWLAMGFGALGAFFSILVRLQSFELRACQQSYMNYWMSFMRILMGAIGGLVLVLIASSPLKDALVKAASLQAPQSVAILGFLGGFAERLVQTIAQRAANAIAQKTGTAVLAARNAEP
jgi:hypothetical protein